jgi:hypothetical protein
MIARGSTSTGRACENLIEHVHLQDQRSLLPYYILVERKASAVTFRLQSLKGRRFGRVPRRSTRFGETRRDKVRAIGTSWQVRLEASTKTASMSAPAITGSHSSARPPTRPLLSLFSFLHHRSLHPLSCRRMNDPSHEPGLPPPRPSSQVLSYS